LQQFEYSKKGAKMRFFGKKRCKRTVFDTNVPHLAAKTKSPDPQPYQTVDKINRVLTCSGADVLSGRYRIALYRFLTDNVPVVSACVATWSRLSAAPGEYEIESPREASAAKRARARLSDLSRRLYHCPGGNSGSLVPFLTDLFTSLYRDGVFGGFLTVRKDGSGVDRFIPLDARNLVIKCKKNHRALVLEADGDTFPLDRDDFYYLPIDSDISRPLGRSILHAIPFVAYIEQQLVDDMRRSSHNSGYHRLHVKVTPPDRIAGESDDAYIERINSYFDSTVSMIKSCQIDENPVTWDNVKIEYVGPGNVRTVTNNWFVNHRGMIEEICAGTNLAPFLLGYSYGATTTWSSFKFDMVMRQVRSVQAQVSALLEWIGNIELALAGIECTCRFKFDNTFAYQASEKAQVDSRRVDSLLKLYEAGLVDSQAARETARRLI
jgi:hypothetical protein